ncbi:STAS domain-containing protein [Chloroflexia bacterium SDU3-3]|nr:STAS domain-containing protein [Chloroflexia bacterium SDU3-3]
MLPPAFYHQLTPEQCIGLFAQLPIPLTIYDAQGDVVGYNQAHIALFELTPEILARGFNMITDPQLAAIGSGELHRRVMQGETIVLPPHLFELHEGGVDVARWTEATYFPLRDGEGRVTHLVAMLRDITETIHQQRSIEQVQQEIDAARQELSEQQTTLEELSTPVIQVWDGILALPLIGAIDSRRAMQVTDSLLTSIGTYQADSVIIDITGIPVVDTQVAAYLLQAARASALLGCDVALVGIGPEIAQTLIQLGVDLQSIHTLANLQAGIAWAFARHGMQVVARKP